MDKKIDFDDIMIVPSGEFSDIVSRRDVKVLDENGMLPLMTAPMDTVINETNSKYFKQNNIYSVITRKAEIDDNYFSTDSTIIYSYSLQQFEDKILNDSVLSQNIKKSGKKFYALIDIANGHMRKLYDAVVKAKEIYGDNIYLMVGNIANPETYRKFCETGTDAIRLGIGNGSGCLTSKQVAIGYPMASLIKECYDISKEFDNPTEIVADGGFKEYSDIIKALALGANKVMLGGILNKCLESCADTYIKNIKHETWTEPGMIVDQYSDETVRNFNAGTKYYKKFRGMSTKGAQKSLGATILKTSEGITKMNEVEYTLSGWKENFEDYLRSSMSYTNNNDFSKFRGNCEIIEITQNAYKRFNK